MKYYITLYCNVVINFMLFYFFVIGVWVISNSIYPKSYWSLLLVIISVIHFIYNLPDEWTPHSIRYDFLKYKNSKILEFLISIKIIYLWVIIIMLPGILLLLFEVNKLINRSMITNNNVYIKRWYSNSFEIFTKITLLVIVPPPKHPYIAHEHKYGIDISIHSKTSTLVYSINRLDFVVTPDFTYIRKSIDIIGYRTSIDALPETIIKIVNNEVLRLGYTLEETTIFIHPYINSKYDTKTEHYITKVYIITNSTSIN